MANFEKFTLKDIRESVRRKLGDTGYDLDTIDECANDFQYELFNDNRIRFMEESTTITAQAGDTQIDFPEDFMTMLNLISYDSATQYSNITKNNIPYPEFMQSNAMFAIAAPQKIRTWTEFGGGMRLSAPTDSEYTLLLDYLRLPEFLKAESDECELPRNYKEMMVLGTLEKVLAVDEELDTSDFTLERLAPLRTSFIRNYGRGSLKVGAKVIRTNRGRGGYRADRDF